MTEPGSRAAAGAPPYRVAARCSDLSNRSRLADRRRCSVAVVVTGWPDDLRAFAAALLPHAPPDVVLLALDAGNVDGSGDVLHEIASAHPGRVEEYHVAGPVGWSEAVTTLARADTAAVHVMADLSTLLTGDALTPLLACLEDPAVVGAGWRGVAVSDDWRSFHDVEALPDRPVAVDALLGYLFAVRRSALLAVGGPHPSARYYRNADLELSFALRAAGLGSLVVPPGVLLVEQARHRGYHDVDPDYRDRESLRTYRRFLKRFRGREDLRTQPRTA